MQTIDTRTQECRYRDALQQIVRFHRTAPGDMTLSDALDRIEAIAREALELAR